VQPVDTSAEEVAGQMDLGALITLLQFLKLNSLSVCHMCIC